MPHRPTSATHDSAINHQNDAEESSAYDDEPSPASRFPQPKFPQEAIEALSALDFGLPPRQEAPPVPSEAHVQPLAPIAPAVPVPAAQNETPLAPAPATPQPIADPAVFDRQNEQHRHPEPTTPPPSASERNRIRHGGRGIGGGPWRVAFRSVEPRLRLQLAARARPSRCRPSRPSRSRRIARNKLELAVEYIELGDLSGARTLLQEVIESNDPATRQPAAALLSTLAPLS